MVNNMWKMLTISYQENANQNYNELLSYPY
jgi:hypothetical protein